MDAVVPTRLTKDVYRSRTIDAPGYDNRLMTGVRVTFADDFLPLHLAASALSSATAMLPIYADQNVSSTFPMGRL